VTFEGLNDENVFELDQFNAVVDALSLGSAQVYCFQVSAAEIFEEVGLFLACKLYA
jgi:hypothetical protein